MEGHLVIRGSFMSGYGVPGMLSFLAVLGGLMAALARIWERPESLTLWLIIIGGAVATLFVTEAMSRRNLVEVSADRVRWSLRQPPDHGDQPISNIRKVEVSPLGARLVFDDRSVVARRVDFRRRDFARLVDALRGHGTQVSDAGAAPSRD